MMLEVIATSVTDARLAQAGGADRIELISGIREGGVTPSIGLIRQVLAAVTIPVHVMVRPHANTFCYDEDDKLTILADIREIRELGAAGIVFGALTPDRRVDEEVLKRVLAVSGGLSVTFHRAFDEAADLTASLRLLGQYPQIRRVLTSGGQSSVLDAVETIRQLDRLGRELSITLLAGSGLNTASLASFLRETGVSEVHMGTGVRRGSDPLQTVDPDKVRAAADIVAAESARRS
ncbi:copper homeostasis protein CutC [Paenibacillus ginsengarvi]|uniref:PF03932 family protein CutC n=1 Tax=Paenibacillus ginsengarvi TaxID=400777 RepID=A0A3B0BII0_9BACL|nr:copper homeostasis protein CutC [Paenibacillus ginsengarvi]RKN72965.1 copper homeostasis protein CutC [Paenibacillus ginsengarvi]